MSTGFVDTLSVIEVKSPPAPISRNPAAGEATQIKTSKKLAFRREGSQARQWWNPAVENQATDRAHRIGQDKPAFVHRLTTAGTIEEKMEALKQRKQALADGILGANTGATLTLRKGDLDILFAASSTLVMPPA